MGHITVFYTELLGFYHKVYCTTHTDPMPRLHHACTLNVVLRCMSQTTQT
jgi:hypothetical protein